jgi:hypothetical protein
VAERAAAGGRDLRQLGTDAGATLRALREVNALQERGPVVNATAQVSSAKVNALDPQHEIVNVAADTEAVKTQMAALDAELAAMINSGNIDEVTAQLEKQGYTAAIAARQLPAYTVALSAARIEAAGIANEKFAKDFADATSAVSDAEAALKKLKKTATGTAKPVRTLSDYANDLANVFKRSFDIRFSSQAALDNITSAFADLRKESEAARISLMQLSADKAVKEYFLSIANAYGDTLRAGQLAAEIAKINQDIADAQSNASTELKGNSAAAIKNRATMRGMVTSYDAYIQSLADSGASQKELQAAIRQGKQDFTDQAIALGFSSTELGIYSSHFDDLATAVQKVPKNVTVTANLNPALQAMNEFVAKSKASGAAAGSAYGAAYAEATLIAAKKAANDTLRTQIAAMRAVLAITTNDSRTTSLMNNINSLVSQMYKDPSGKAYATGGYTGAGGKYDVAGIVHKGEYVVPKSQVNQSTGLPYGQTNNPSYFSGGLVGGGSGMMMVSLSPEDRGLLRQIGGSGEVVLYANNEAIARSSSAGSKSIVASGGRL